MCSLEELKNYNEIKEEFSNANILLGNGFSINFSDTFRYKKLYDSFIRRCSDTSKKLFKGLGDTYNFEKVLESIEIAETICKSLNINYNEFENHKKEIKEGLIESIKNVHPNPNPKIDDPNWPEIRDKLDLVSNQFYKFDNIFTTNYDILIYYNILYLNDKNKNKDSYNSYEDEFSDYFFSRIGCNYLDEKYTFFNNKFKYETDSLHKHHIYYLHGALFLFEQNFNTCKIKAKNFLLDDISKEIENNNYPIFVSEGTSNSKLKAIKSNDYLTFCLEQFENKINSNKRLVIFGHSLSAQDQHLVDIINKNCEKIAISISSDEYPTPKDLELEKDRIYKLFKTKDKEKEIYFYEAKSLFDFYN